MSHAYVIVIHVAYQSNTVLRHSVAMHTTLVLFVGPIKINVFPILHVAEFVDVQCIVPT